MSAELDKMMQENEEADKRNRNMGLAITFGIFVLLLGISMYWVAFASTIPPIDELEWKTIGSVSADFGNEVEGSKNVNNFRDPSPTPADKPKVEPKAEPKTDPAPAAVTPEASPNIESNTTSENTVAETKPVKAEPKTSTASTKPDVKPTTNPETTDNANPTATTNNTTGGSNDGNSNTTGNSGNPKAQVLNDDGMFQFGNGIGGPGGRMPLKIKMPDYNVQTEAKITFSFVIAPSGEVILVRPEMTTHTDLARIGADAIKRWRFSEVEPSRGNLKTTVTITFRLE